MTWSFKPINNVTRYVVNISFKQSSYDVLHVVIDPPILPNNGLSSITLYLRWNGLSSLSISDGRKGFVLGLGNHHMFGLGTSDLYLSKTNWRIVTAHGTPVSPPYTRHMMVRTLYDKTMARQAMTWGEQHMLEEPRWTNNSSGPYFQRFQRPRWTTPSKMEDNNNFALGLGKRTLFCPY